MIALDTSAIVAIALDEQEEEYFSRKIAIEQALVGTPTLVECRMVLTAKNYGVDHFLGQLLARPSIHPVAFSIEMYQASARAFDRYGKGMGHPAQLNFGDCMAYAVAKVHDVPLLYKGTDFDQTDIRPALP